MDQGNKIFALYAFYIHKDIDIRQKVDDLTYRNVTTTRTIQDSDVSEFEDSDNSYESAPKRPCLDNEYLSQV